MAREFTNDDDALLAELGIEVEVKKAPTRSPQEERIIAGFEEVQRFVAEHGRIPEHGETNDIFERLYAVRLDRIREQQEAHDLVAELDHQGLLEGATQDTTPLDEDVDDDALLAELGIDVDALPITKLKHVRSTAEKKAAEDIANRERCKDFETFRPIFNKIQNEIKSGLRSARPFVMRGEIEKGEFFILAGQKAYVAEKGEAILTNKGRTDARLRVIFDNGTESDLLMRSLERALQKDDAGRRITEPTAGPLFSDQNADGDEASGIIYVLRSKSDHPLVTENRELVHKIGVTNTDVGKRIAGAHLQPTFLMANVEVVATYELYNINRTKLENLLHRIFEPARLDIEIMDRFGRPVVPREWFLVPLFVIKDAVEKIKDGTITDYFYDKTEASLKSRDS
jgi:hypothetical protein